MYLEKQEIMALELGPVTHGGDLGSSFWPLLCFLSNDSMNGRSVSPASLLFCLLNKQFFFFLEKELHVQSVFKTL